MHDITLILISSVLQNKSDLWGVNTLKAYADRAKAKATRRDSIDVVSLLNGSWVHWSESERD